MTRFLAVVLVGFLSAGQSLVGEDVDVLVKRAEAYEIFKKAEPRLAVLTAARGKKLKPNEEAEWQRFMVEVKAAYLKCLELHPDFADACEALHRCALLAEGAKPTGERMAYLERAIEIDPARYWVYLTLAGDYLATGQAQKARELMKSVEKFHPPTAESMRAIISSDAFMEREKEKPGDKGE